MSLNQEEEEYIERLYREMYTRLCIYAMSALGSKALAEEVVQDKNKGGSQRCRNPKSIFIEIFQSLTR